jgi:hypothetical protein
VCALQNVKVLNTNSSLSLTLDSHNSKPRFKLSTAHGIPCPLPSSDQGRGLINRLTFKAQTWCPRDSLRICTTYKSGSVSLPLLNVRTRQCPSPPPSDATLERGVAPWPRRSCQFSNRQGRRSLLPPASREFVRGCGCVGRRDVLTRRGGRGDQTTNK